MKPAETTAIALIVLLAGLPLAIDVEASYSITFLFYAFLYVTIAQSWNLIAGFAGQMSLGQHAFFGAGAYATGIAWTMGFTAFLDPRAFLLAALVGAALACAVGIPLLSKLSGDYFALGTLGLGEVLRVLVTQGGEFTGGATGLLLPSGAYTGMTPYYYLALGLALGSTVVCRVLMDSRMGLALRSIRDDPAAAAASGVRVLRYKVLAFVVSGALTALAGSLYAYNTFQVMPGDVFGLQWCLYPVLMSIVGGIGTLSGPVVGAFALAVLFHFSSLYLPTMHPLLSGMFIVVFAMWLPQGVLGITRPPVT